MWVKEVPGCGNRDGLADILQAFSWLKISLLQLKLKFVPWGLIDDKHVTQYGDPTRGLVINIDVFLTGSVS